MHKISVFDQCTLTASKQQFTINCEWIFFKWREKIISAFFHLDGFLKSNNRCSVIFLHSFRSFSHLMASANQIKSTAEKFQIKKWYCIIIWVCLDAVISCSRCIADLFFEYLSPKSTIAMRFSLIGWLRRAAGLLACRFYAMHKLAALCPHTAHKNHLSPQSHTKNLLCVTIDVNVSAAHALRTYHYTMYTFHTTLSTQKKLAGTLVFYLFSLHASKRI